jgi:hypothetical protein
VARGLSSGLNTELANDSIKFCFLFELLLSTTYRLTDNDFSITYNSNTYTPTDKIIGLDGTVETGELKVEEITLSLSNVDSTFRTIFEAENYIDNKVNIYLASIDSSDAFVDAFVYFSGYVKTAQITESTKNSTIDVVLANQFANWNLKKGRHFTDESQQNVYSGDQGMEFSHLTKADIRWGS